MYVYESHDMFNYNSMLAFYCSGHSMHSMEQRRWSRLKQPNTAS